MARTTVYNQITDDEKIKQINPENKQLAEDFLDYLSSIDRSPGTIRGYKNDLDIFFVWNLEHNGDKNFIDIKKREFARFQGFALNEWGWGAKRIRRVKSAVSSMSNFIENILSDEDEDFENYRSVIKKIESPPNEAVREKTVLSDEEVDKFLDDLVAQGKYQKACVFALAAMSGARKSELLRFKVEYFSDDNLVFDGALYMTPKIKTKGRGKNGKMINKYVLCDFKKYYDLWMKEREELGIESEWLFVSKSADGWEQMKVATLNSWAKSFSRALGVDFYWHSLRHFLTTRMKRYNIPDHIIQEWNQWSTGELVNIYSDIEATDEFGKYFSKNGLVEGKEGSISDMGG